MKQEQQQEALDRAKLGLSVANYSAIFQGFLEKGIPESEIKPRENVFTFNAWRALGRSVRKGEHGVKVNTFVEMTSKEADKDTGERKRFRAPRTTTVFHITQTDPITQPTYNELKARLAELEAGA